MIEVGELLRALILEAMTLLRECDADGRILQFILDSIRAQAAARLSAPTPGAARLARTDRHEPGRTAPAMRLLEALARLPCGQPATRIAYDAGYASPSAFTVAFQRAFGAPPGRSTRWRS